MTKFSNIKAVIFDFDGLMIDSEPFWDKADTELLRRRSKTYSFEVRKNILGRSQRESMEYFKNEFGLSEEIEKLIDERLIILYELMLPQVKLMEGVEEVIKRLNKKGLLMALATGGHRKDGVIKILSMLGIIDYFPVIVTFQDINKGKPAPDAFVKTAELLKIAPELCLVLEDSPNGVIAGKSAGMMVYGVNKDKDIYDELKDAGADRVFRTLVELNYESSFGS